MAGCTVATVAGLALLPFEREWSLPRLFEMRGLRPPPAEIAIVAIHGTAGEQMGLSNHTGNWPRSVYAGLIQRLSSVDARLIVMDIAFRERRSDAEDQALADAVRQSGRVLLFTYLRRYQLASAAGWLDIEEVVPPIPPLAKAALGSGAFTLPKYPARVYQVPLWHELASGPAASQPLLAFMALQPEAHLQRLHRHLGASSASNVSLAEQLQELHKRRQQFEARAPEEPQLGYLWQLLDDSSARVINYYGPPETIPTYSIDQVLLMSQEALAAQFAGKIVYVGFSNTLQTEQRDAYRTVFSNNLGVDLSGVEISATVFANLWDRSFIQGWPLWLAVVVCAGFFLMALLCHRLSRLNNLAGQTLVVGLYSGVVIWQFAQQRWLPWLAPSATLLMGNGYALSVHYRQNVRRLRAIRQALGHYLPPAAAARLGRDFNVLENRHQLVHGVCLLTDVRGYTTLSEQMQPDALHQMMNDYYGLLVDVVKKNGGTVGNIVGDSLLALWHGDALTPEMCLQALTAARQIQEQLAERPELARRLPTCAALHGGQFSLGNLGAAGHFEYSPVGDIINTASRVEHFNRDLGTGFLCTTPIAQMLEQLSAEKAQALRYLGCFRLRNRQAATGLYTFAAAGQLQQAFALALEAYEGSQREQARPLFADLAARFTDGPSLYYLKQCTDESDTAPTGRSLEKNSQS